MIVRIAFLVALAFVEPPAESVYLGDRRQACGDPLKWSDGQVSGPGGRVTTISGSGTLTLVNGNGRRAKFRLAGVALPRNPRDRDEVRRFFEERLLGKQVETLLYVREQRGVKVGVLLDTGHDIALEMVTAGRVQYVPSRFLTAYDNCLYGEAERIAREVHQGIWAH